MWLPSTRASERTTSAWSSRAGREERWLAELHPLRQRTADAHSWLNARWHWTRQKVFKEWHSHFSATLSDKLGKNVVAKGAMPPVADSTRRAKGPCSTSSTRCLSVRIFSRSWQRYTAAAGVPEMSACQS